MADLQKVVADFALGESEKVKVPPNRCRRRVECGGKQFAAVCLTESCKSRAPILGQTDLAEELARTQDFTNRQRWRVEG